MTPTGLVILVLLVSAKALVVLAVVTPSWS
jgi:hypothetical protein